MTDKKLVRREAPRAAVTNEFWKQGLADLAAGRHIPGCDCIHDKDRDRDASGFEYEMLIPINACTTLARKLAAFESYSVEVEVDDASV